MSTNLGHYTYVTLVMHEGRAPSLEVSFHTSDLRISSSVISDERPYLAISTPEGGVSISTTGAGPVTDADLATARMLAHSAAQYLADCERLHAIRHTPSPSQDEAA
ncbi:hypothetical protein AB0K48_19240 [Nonomuraea sp. NPDC055795]